MSFGSVGALMRESRADRSADVCVVQVGCRVVR